MRIAIEFEGKNLSFPIEYNHLIQGFIYHNIDENLATFLHEKGFMSKERRFKLFTFSRLLGKYRINRDIIKFDEKVRFWIASPVSDIIESFASNLARRPEVLLGDEKLFVTSIEVKPLQSFEDKNIFMLSPMTIYSTLLKPDGKKKTYYYNPKEDEFGKLINENIKKKYRAFHSKDPCDLSINITPVKVRASDEKIVIYKGFIIKGWMGFYRIWGDNELLSLAYDTGLGAKNSQGFGMFEIKK